MTTRPFRPDIAPAFPPVLVLTACPWTGRALEEALHDAGFGALRARDAGELGRHHSLTELAAVIVDDGGAEAPNAREGTRRLLATMRTVPTVPAVVLVRDLPTVAETEELLAAGAWGVVPFPLGAPTWLAQLATWIRAGAAWRAQERRSLLDPLTGLYNGHGIAQRASEVDAAARRNGIAVASAVFTIEPLDDGAPLDRAREDAQAVRVAGACRRVGRASDVFGRVGEREFVVIAPATDASGVRAIVGRVADAVAREPGADRIRLEVRASPGAHPTTL